MGDTSGPETERSTAAVRLSAAEMEPLFREAFPEERFLVVSNREPYEHSWGEDVGEEIREAYVERHGRRPEVLWQERYES